MKARFLKECGAPLTRCATKCIEHGKIDPETDVTGDDDVLTAKIALAHLQEFPDYYTRLEKLEAEAEEFWKADEK